MAGRGRTAAAAPAATSRCRSRCELRRADGYYRCTGLLRRAQAASSTARLPAGCGRAGCLGRRDGDSIDVIFCAAYAAAGRGSRGREANIAASAASWSGRAGSLRSWLRLACAGVSKHVQTASRQSPPCPRNPCPPLLPVRTAPAAAVLSSHRDPPQVQLARRLGWVAYMYALWRRLAASERASRPCCCGAALQLAGGGAGCAAGVPRSGPPVPAVGGYRSPRATRAPGSIRGLSRAPGGAPERSRGMAGARRPCAPAPGRAPPVLGRST